MRIPSKEEINPCADCLDGQWAVGHYLGKSLEEAEALFIENDIYYAGDLLWMGATAFTYYFKAALAYLKREECHEASDFVNTIISTLDSRLLGEYNDLQAIKNGFPEYIEFCEYVVQYYDRFDLDEEIYGDLRAKIRPILKTLKEG